MRLLDTSTGEFRIFPHPPDRFAILSHVWSRPAPSHRPLEQTFDDTTRILRSLMPGETPLSKYSEKIRQFCQAAQKIGLTLGWVDSCCIDKSDQDEASIAIKSMYEWYHNAEVCFVFLQDVDAAPDSQDFEAQFLRSEWFTRGWTLQELLAPRNVIFLSSRWKFIGSKASLARAISLKTKIDPTILTLEKSLEAVCVAHRLSWAASRSTTRLEDWAYSLMGVCGVQMDVRYGEGVEGAFVRLQEEIAKHRPHDQSLFGWGQLLPPESPDLQFRYPTRFRGFPIPLFMDRRKRSPVGSHLASSTASPPRDRHLFASSPKDFFPPLPPGLSSIPLQDFAKTLGVPPKDLYPPPSITPSSVKIRLPTVAVHIGGDRDGAATSELAILGCEDPHRGYVALILSSQDPDAREHVVGAVVPPPTHPSPFSDPCTIYNPSVVHYRRKTYVRREQLAALRKDGLVKMKEFSIAKAPLPHCSRGINTGRGAPAPHNMLSAIPRDVPLDVRLSRPSITLLQTPLGCVVNPSDDVNISMGAQNLSHHQWKEGLVISKDNMDIRIHIGRCGCESGQQNGTLGVIVSCLDAVPQYYPSEYVNEYHPTRHPIHVGSWDFDSVRGAFTRTFPLQFPSDEKISLRLSIDRFPSGTGIRLTIEPLLS